MLKKMFLSFILFIFSLVLAAEDQSHLRQVVTMGEHTAGSFDGYSLWHNPAGLSFQGGTLLNGAYIVDSVANNNRGLGLLGISSNFLNTISYGFGFMNGHSYTKDSRQFFGTSLSGIFGLSLKLGSQSSFGFSAFKYKNFYLEKSSDVHISFGFQSRLNETFAIGALYQEVNDGIFSAPNFHFGFLAKPKSFLIMGLEGILKPNKTTYKEGFYLNPRVLLKTSLGGVDIFASAETPIKEDLWKYPLFGGGIDLNFEHLGIGFVGGYNTNNSAFNAGARFRASSEKWKSIIKKDPYYVAINVDENGNFESKPKTLLQKILYPYESHPLEVLSLLRFLKNDENVAGIVIKFAGFNVGRGQTYEWYKALLDLKSAGKEVIVYLDRAQERDLFIASAANKIILHPDTIIDLSRFRATLYYLKDTLNKIGIKAEAVVAGSHKTAPRQFVENKPQKEEIETTTHILQFFYDQLVETVSKNRNLDQDDFKFLLDEGAISCDKALASKLIDKIDYYEDYLNSLDFNFRGDYISMPKKNNRFSNKPIIAVLQLSGTIVDGRVLPSLFPSSSSSVGDKDFIDEVNKIVSDKDVKAIIVRINSPGGSSTASHNIYKSLKDAQKSKPVIISMGDVAASGGYYAALGGEKIFANKTTITGSIGVFSLMFHGQDLFEKKIDLYSKEISIAKNPGPSLFRGYTSEEYDKTKSLIDWSYENFKNIVSKERDIPKETVNFLSEGKIWLGHEAKENKLIDEEGTFLDAYEYVKNYEELNLIDEEVSIALYYPGLGQRSFFTNAKALFMNEKGEYEETRLIGDVFKDHLQSLSMYRLQNTPLYLMPYLFDI